MRPGAGGRTPSRLPDTSGPGRGCGHRAWAGGQGRLGGHGPCTGREHLPADGRPWRAASPPLRIEQEPAMRASVAAFAVDGTGFSGTGDHPRGGCGGFFRAGVSGLCPSGRGLAEPRRSLQRPRGSPPRCRVGERPRGMCAWPAHRGLDAPERCPAPDGDGLRRRYAWAWLGSRRQPDAAGQGAPGIPVGDRGPPLSAASFYPGAGRRARTISTERRRVQGRCCTPPLGAPGLGRSACRCWKARGPSAESRPPRASVHGVRTHCARERPAASRSLRRERCRHWISTVPRPGIEPSMNPRACSEMRPGRRLPMGPHMLAARPPRRKMERRPGGCNQLATAGAPRRRIGPGCAATY